MDGSQEAGEFAPTGEEVGRSISRTGFGILANSEQH